MRGVGTLNKATPLWIIDGVPGMPLDNFNEVESIQLLKDAASAAIYGIEAANGVVLVTTKKGSKGKIAVNYNGYVKELTRRKRPYCGLYGHWNGIRSTSSVEEIENSIRVGWRACFNHFRGHSRRRILRMVIGYHSHHFPTS